MGNRRISAGTVGAVLLAASVWPALHFFSGRVRRSRRGAGAPRRAGRLGVRLFGQGNPVLVLLPGIAASQAHFGAAYDRLGEVATVIVIDPLGFGSSMDAGVSTDSFALGEHLAAIPGALRALDLDGRPLHVAGHSMGASLAIQRADVALNPTMPAAIARDGVNQTWFSYIQSFEALVAADTWTGAVAALSGRGVPVLLVDGEMDPVPVPGRARALASEFAGVTARAHRGDHDLALAPPDWCSDLLYRLIAAA